MKAGGGSHQPHQCAMSDCARVAPQGRKYCNPCRKARNKRRREAREAARAKDRREWPEHYVRKDCQSDHCWNTAKRGAAYCTPCQSLREHENLRERVHGGERVPREDWEGIVEEDVADAAWEAYKWALRDGKTPEQATRASTREAASVEQLHRQARRPDLSEDERQEALALLTGGEAVRRAGQQAAAVMIGEAAERPMTPPSMRGTTPTSKGD